MIVGVWVSPGSASASLRRNARPPHSISEKMKKCPAILMTRTEGRSRGCPVTSLATSFILCENFCFGHHVSLLLRYNPSIAPTLPRCSEGLFRSQCTNPCLRTEDIVLHADIPYVDIPQHFAQGRSLKTEGSERMNHSRESASGPPRRLSRTLRRPRANGSFHMDTA